MFSVFRESSPRGDEDVSHLHNTTDTPSSDKTHHHPEDVGGDSPLPRFPPLSREQTASCHTEEASVATGKQRKCYISLQVTSIKAAGYDAGEAPLLSRHSRYH